MDNSLLIETKEAVTQWVKSNHEKQKSNNISLEILINDDNCLRVELNFGQILAEILVTEPYFAPFRYVSFQAMDVVDGTPALVHFWYDDKTTKIEDINMALDDAVNACLAYQNRLIT